MERHSEKRRDMARSILPSKNREAARAALNHTKRGHRHAIHQELAAFRGVARQLGVDDPDDWDEHVDLGSYPDAEIGVAVRWRRRGDKVNHFIRWAIATTADVPIEDRLTTLSAMLDDGLIGRHAMTHLADEPQLSPPREHDARRRWREQRQARRDQEAAGRAMAFDHLTRLLHDTVCAPGGLASLNRAMKTCDQHQHRSNCDGCRRRCLAGLHDIDAFVRDVAAIERLDRTERDGPAGLPRRALRRWLQDLAIAVAGP